MVQAVVKIILDHANAPWIGINYLLGIALKFQYLQLLLKKACQIGLILIDSLLTPFIILLNECVTIEYSKGFYTILSFFVFSPQ